MLFLPRITSILWFSFFISWEQRKLGEISRTTIGEFVIRTKQNDNSPYPVYNGGTSFTGFYEEFNNEGNKIIISARGANAGFVNVVKTRYWAGNSCYSVDLLDKIHFDTDFIYHEMKRNQSRFLDNQQAANIPSVSKTDVEKFNIDLPQVDEQKRISKFFDQIDSLITLHQRKQNGLNLWFLSKKCTSNLANEWEQCKLGDIVSVCSGKDYKHLGEGDIPVYGTGGYMLSVSDALSYSDDAIGIGRKGTIDKPYILKAPFWTVDTLFYAVPKEKKALDFVYCLFQIIDWKSKDESTGVPSLSKIAINSVDVSIPKSEEQVQIGTVFLKIDNLITLHQCKEKSRIAHADKKVMFHATLKLANDWEHRKLGDIGKTYGGLSGKAKEDFGHGDAKFVTYMNVFSNPVGDPAMTEAIELDSRQNEIKKGDIFFTTSSETPDEVGMSSVWMENMPNTYLNSFCFGYRPTLKFDLYYLAYVLRSDSIRNKFIFLAQGISRYNISKNKVMEMSIPIPSMEEQVFLGKLFKNLDNLITLHQREQKDFSCHAGEIVKLQKNQKLTDDWEQRKLGEIAIEVNRTDANSNAPIMMITANDGFIEQSERYAFNNAGESLKRYIVLQKGELAYNHGASKLRPYGSCFALIKQEKARIPFVYHCFSVENHNPEFVSIELNGNDVESQLRRIVSSGARMDGLLNISFQDYASISILLPEKAEQDKIASVFRNLDNLITLHQRGENKYKRRQT